MMIRKLLIIAGTHLSAVVVVVVVIFSDYLDAKRFARQDKTTQPDIIERRTKSTTRSDCGQLVPAPPMYLYGYCKYK